MIFHCIGSSSSGNGYFFKDSNGKVLILECGVKTIEFKKALNWQMSDIVGVLTTHEHNDHSLNIQDFAKMGIHVYALREVLDAKGVTTFGNPILPMKKYQLGPYQVFTLPVAHDVPCLAFVICHPEMGKVLFVTDTMMLEYKVKGLNHICIECNYSDDALTRAIECGRTPEAMRSRLLQSHMELETTVGVLRANDLSVVNEVVLIHLSGNNSDGAEFVRRIEQETGKPTYVAKKGLELEFD